MHDFDVISIPRTYSVVVMHYLELNGSITLTFTPGSNVQQILIQLSKAISEQPSLHTEYLLHHSWLPSDYFAGALLLVMTYKEWRGCLFSFMYTMPSRPASFGVPRGSWCSFCISNIIRLSPIRPRLKFKIAGEHVRERQVP
jgi:hypothetical protein